MDEPGPRHRERLHLLRNLLAGHLWAAACACLALAAAAAAGRPLASEALAHLFLLDRLWLTLALLPLLALAGGVLVLALWLWVSLGLAARSLARRARRR